MARFRDTWLFSMDWIFIAMGTFCISKAAKADRLMSNCNAYLGYVISFFAVLCFILDVSRLGISGSWGVLSITSGLTRLVVGTIAFPIWVILLGNNVGNYSQGELGSL